MRPSGLGAPRKSRAFCKRAESAAGDFLQSEDTKHHVQP
jgi:hypothetical protein